MYQFFEDVPYEFRLVGEGAANCVFEVRGYPQTEAHRYLQGRTASGYNDKKHIEDGQLF